jgi:hypothetical protein
VNIGAEVECFPLTRTPDGVLTTADQADLSAQPCYDARDVTRMYDHLTEISQAMNALGRGNPRHDSAGRARHAEQYRELGSDAGFYDDFQDGRDPAGITTQDPVLAARLDPVEGARRVANYLRVLTMEAQTLARACGKSRLRNLEPEDLVALTVESAAMARVPLAGTNWIPGATGHG